MRKFHALYTNEMIKISRKIIVIIILAIMAGGIIAIGGLVKIQQKYEQNTSQKPDFNQIQNNMQSQLDFFKSQLSDIEQKISAAQTADEKAMLERDKLDILMQIAKYQKAIDYGVNLDSSGYKARLIDNIYNIDKQIRDFETIPEEQRSEEQKAAYNLLKQKSSRYVTILENSDFAGYIKELNLEIDNTPGITADEKKLKKETNLLWLKLDPKGEAGANSYGNPLESTLSQIENLKRSLLYNIDFSAQSIGVKPLTPAGRQQTENDLAVLLYKAENNLIEKDNNSATQVFDSTVSGMFTFGLFMIVCMMLIIAGGAVSQEISTGSIKSLIISPVKRYKIFFAKLASLLTVGIVAALLLYVLTILVSGLFFGFGNGSSFVFAIDGVVKQMNFYVYRFAYLSVNFIDVIAYMIFAYMLSIITRNTAVSVGLSIAIYFGGGLVNSFISLLAKGEWLKFIPFNNLSLASRIFPDPLGRLASMFGNRAVLPSVGFSLVYISVMILCFGYIALDSFDRRDIK
ncbi:MAG: ABC transporter permease [Saccharofermentanales bacterium]